MPSCVSERPAAEPARADWRGGPLDEAVERALAAGASLAEITQAASDAAVRLAFAHEQCNLRRAAHRLGVTDEEMGARAAGGAGGNGTRRGITPAPGSEAGAPAWGPDRVWVDDGCLD